MKRNTVGKLRNFIQVFALDGLYSSVDLHLVRSQCLQGPAAHFTYNRVGSSASGKSRWIEIKKMTKAQTADYIIDTTWKPGQYLTKSLLDDPMRIFCAGECTCELRFRRGEAKVSVPSSKSERTRSRILGSSWLL